MVRRILITGANKGIGFAIANRCLQDHSDTHVILGCRSVARGEAAKAVGPRHVGARVLWAELEGHLGVTSYKLQATSYKFG